MSPYGTKLTFQLTLDYVVIKHRRCGAARPRPKAHGTEALLRDAAVLIAWQHQDIPGISQSILTQTWAPLGTFNIPKTWPTERRGAARYDLVFVSTGQLATVWRHNLMERRNMIQKDMRNPATSTKRSLNTTRRKRGPKPAGGRLGGPWIRSE
jgi:hypothetical protein